MKNIIAESIENVKGIIGIIFELSEGFLTRTFGAHIANEYGRGGQSFVSKEYGLSRTTIRKGMREIESGIIPRDHFELRGNKKTTERFPKLKEQIKEVLDSQSQTDPKFKTGRLYTKLGAKTVRKEILEKYKYKDEELPTERTFCNILNEMGYVLKSVKKTEPLKKIPETEAIFDNLKEVHEAADNDDNTIRISIDAKNKVKTGDFSRGGKSRAQVKACDHDFGDKSVIPYGIMNVKEKTAEIYLCESKVTADCIADLIQDYCEKNNYYNSGKRLLINMDNGPENNSHRTQFIKRMIEFSAESDMNISLAYYPPYHSKYNPIERYWGILENHWNGSLIDSTETAAKYIRTMTYDGKHPEVSVVEEIYPTGVKVKKKKC